MIIIEDRALRLSLVAEIRRRAGTWKHESDKLQREAFYLSGEKYSDESDTCLRCAAVLEQLANDLDVGV